MRFSSLGSGSKGNATIVQHNKTVIMVDCGFSGRSAEKKLLQKNIEPSSINAILITHEHKDHTSGIERLSQKYRIPVWTNKGTYKAINQQEFHQINFFSSHNNFSINDMKISPFPVPHDAKEPVQFIFTDGDKKLAVLSDLGKITPHIKQKLNSVDALMLECNHDSCMLEIGKYPRFLKERVGGGLGHLSNKQSAEFLLEIDTSKLTQLVASHISENNNTHKKVKQTVSQTLGCSENWINTVCQNNGIDWLEV